VTDHDPEVSKRYRDLVPFFEMMRELFEILNRRRHRRGSIDFDLKEPEFMLVANETVAQHLSDNDVPTLYRIHEDPDPLKVEQFEEFISTLGYALGAAADQIRPR